MTIPDKQINESSEQYVLFWKSTADELIVMIRPPDNSPQ